MGQGFESDSWQEGNFEYVEEFSFDNSLYGIFVNKARETPSSIAAIHEDEDQNVISLTYGELYIAVDMVAKKIQDLGIETPVTIGVYGERSIYTLISMLAIFKSGNTYVPIDIAYPESHIEYILEDATLSLILSRDQYLAVLPVGQVKIQTLDFIDLNKVPASSDYEEIAADRSSPNYPSLIMYTSGSTGKPKGVKHKQRQLINRFNWVWKNYPFEAHDRMCQRTNVNFMPSFWEFLGGILGGIPTVILADLIIKDPGKLIKALAKHKVTCFQVVPSLLRRMLESAEDLELLSGVRFWITAGEPLPFDLFTLFVHQFPNSILLNDYGSTEVNGVLYFDTRNIENTITRLPGFKPIANIKAYILDEDLKLCPVGVPGELHIGGVSLAIEYLNLPEETQRKFIADPFDDSKDNRLYKMGDLAKYMPDGTIELLGRADQQVKIRGIRVELPAIEKVLSEHQKLKENIVFAREIRSGVKQLYACIVVKKDNSLTDDELRSFLETKLPEYMIPSWFIRLKELPRTPSGKVDRQLIINSDITNLVKELGSDADSCQKETCREYDLEEIKERLKEIAADVLGIGKDDVAAHKKFYAVGFDSMTIVDFLNKINHFYQTKLEVAHIYDHAKIDELAEFIVAEQSNGKMDLSLPVMDEPSGNSPVMEPKVREPEVKTEEKIESSIIESSTVESSLVSTSIKEIIRDQERMNAEALKEQLIELAASALGVKKADIEVGKKFYALGFDSMTIVDFLNKINQFYQTKLEVSHIYDHAKIDELAEFMVTEQSNGKMDLSPPVMDEPSGNSPVMEPKAGEPEVETEEKIESSIIESSTVESSLVSTSIKEIIRDQKRMNAEALKEQLVELAASALGVKKANIEVGKKFYALGFDSMTIVDFLNRINASFGIKLEVSDLYNHARIDELVEFLGAKYQDVDQKNISNCDLVNISSIPDQNTKTASSNEESAGITAKDKPDMSKKIAIIGVSGKFPGAANIKQFWDNLANGVDSVVEVPKNRWDIDAYYDTDIKKPFKTVSKWGGFVDDIDLFDPDFFSIPPRESEFMDPQQRLCMEESWKALEDAGYQERDLSDRAVGVFIGARPGDYSNLINENSIAPDPYTTTGCDFAILAARVAYHLNLKGPCLSVDTACSSSMVAIHLACNSILAGECDIAIAGGVCIMSTPDLLLKSSKMNMLSPDGCCKTFDDEANGIVLGEGVGIVVLKRLDQALEDNDRIYGVIVGSGINQDGKTNGITAPSASAQFDLINSVYQKNDIHPEDIRYVECHGTGTKLGDPIEIKALSQVFQARTSQKKFCAVGSVKTNIGHTIGCSGVAGLIKILLAMENGQIPGTLHFKKPNQHIDFDASPFYVNTNLTAWDKPRLAAISSFGFSGTNCHMVIEEAPAWQYKKSPILPYYLIPLSAKTRPALLRKITDLKNWLAGEGKDYPLDEIAYTLQKGRSHFACRIALIVENSHDLHEKLQTPFEAEKEPFIFSNPDGMITERTKFAKAPTNGVIPSTKDECKEALLKLASFYVNGGEVDWRALNKDSGRRPIPIPTYSFERERYWISKNAKDLLKDFDPNTREIHPLIGENLSTLREQKFGTLFRAGADFIKEHIINNYPVLPGVAQLEMALNAGKISCEKEIKAIHSVIWKNPVVFSKETRQVYTWLVPQGNDVQFIIEAEDEVAGTVQICEGVLELKSRTWDSEKAFDLDEIKRRCSTTKKGARLYKYFSGIGIQYGAGYQTVKEMVYNQKELLAYLELAPGLFDFKGKYVLIPQLLDGAIHSMAGFDSVFTQGLAYLPFALDRMEIVKPLENKCYAYVCLDEGIISKTSGVVKSDIHILNCHGELLIKITGFTVKNAQLSGFHRLPMEDETKTLFFTGGWKAKQTLPREATTAGDLVIFSNRIYDWWGEAPKYNRVVCVKEGKAFRRISDTMFEVGDKLEDYIEFIRSLTAGGAKELSILYLWALDGLNGFSGQVAYLNRGVYSLFYLAKALLQETSPGNQVHLIFAYSGDIQDSLPLYAGIASFIKTVSLEKPDFNFKSLEIETSGIIEYKALLPLFLDELVDRFENREIRYENGVRSVKNWERIEAAPDPQISYQGLYVITGGLGGVGFILARYLLSKPGCSVVLIGRSELEGFKKERFDTLKVINENVKYFKADVCNYGQLEEALRESRNSFGNITGLLHCAGLIKDNLIINKEKSEFDAVLQPKLQGTMYLDELTAGDKLDFFAMFSSITSAFGNAGQCDYAYANRFMDCFAAIREVKRRGGKRSGKTVSINWPLWEEGGMHLSFEIREKLKRDKGMTCLESGEGIRAFESSLKLECSSLMVLAGYEKPLTDMVQSENGVTPVLAETGAKLANIQYDDSGILLKTESYLCKIISKETGLSVEKLKPVKDFDEYGMNSLMIMNLTDELEKHFGKLSKTLFFEYRNIGELAEYFQKNHQDKLQFLYETLPVLTNRSQVKRDEPVNLIKKPIRERKYLVDTANRIAIIGVSGRYPMADTLDVFWNNLTASKDCITEIPMERWDYRKYFDSDRNAKGKVYSKWGGFIDGIDKFDPLFFNISPKEAELMDPQERMFLENAWETIENAGYTRSRLSSSKVGVYVGVMWGQYQLYGVNDALDEKPTSNYASIANRVSYVFNFSGPSMAIDSMCSSSFSAIKLACDGLIKGEIDYALAGGVNVMPHPNKYYMLCQGSFGSTDGRCRSFGAGGDGYVPGEGVGAVLLKSFDRALQDGDYIYGVIIGSALNHGGKTNGYIVPSPISQARLIIDGIKNAAIDPRSISYIEAHGTGTALGDPIEIDGITKAFGEFTKDKQFCPIGSVKSNVGHLESAAGIVALTKVLLQMKHKLLVPSIHSNSLNPRIDFENSPVYVQRELSYWEKPVIDKDGVKVTCPRRAGISSFGAGGSNAFILIEEYERGLSATDSNDFAGKRIIVLSARNEEQLRVYAAKLRTYLKNQEYRGIMYGDDRERISQSFENNLIHLIATVTGVSKDMIKADDELECYLIHTYDLVHFISQINKKYDIAVSLYLISTRMTIGEMARIIFASYADRIGAYYMNPDSAVKVIPQQGPEVLSLADLAYTLQIGREPMDERLAIVAESIDELSDKLEHYLRNEKSRGLFYSACNQKNDPSNILELGVDINATLKNGLSMGKHEEIAKLWVEGLDIDWSQLDDSAHHSIIPLPSYPFNRERYWITAEGVEEDLVAQPVLHPLLDRNLSTFFEQSYRKVFRNNAFYIKDHVIGEQMFVPGAVLVEMARAAGELSKNSKQVTKIRNMQWLSPLIMDGERKEVGINLYPSSGQVVFEIFSGQEERKVHAKGLLIYENKGIPAPEVNIQEILNRCGAKMTKESCYALFNEKGLYYGPDFQTIDALHFNENEALSYLTFSNHRDENCEMRLQPLLLDGAMQSVLGLEKSAGPTEVYLPFSVDEITIYDALPMSCFVYVTRRGDKYNLKILDTTGRVLTNLDGFFLTKFTTGKNLPVGRRSELLYFKKSWIERELLDSLADRQMAVLVFDMDDDRFNLFAEQVDKSGNLTVIRVKPGATFKIENQGFEINLDQVADYDQLFAVLKETNVHPTHILYLWDSPTASLETSFETLARELSVRLLYLCKALYGANLKNKARVLLSFFGAGSDLFSAAANAFLKSAFLENQKHGYKTVAFSNPVAKTADTVSILAGELLAMGTAIEEIQYSANKRFFGKLDEITLPSVTPRDFNTFTPGGVYLITGGAGGLGMVFSNYFAQKGFCTVILVGRSELDSAKQEILNNIKGIDIHYLRADITKLDDVQQLYRNIKQDFGKLNGIIHSAGVIRDSLIGNKTIHDLEQVLAPKVAGLINLDKVTQDEPLDFLVVFSSIASVMGNRGQVDYAFANGFMDAFVEQRNRWVQNGKRHGVTISINWPLWEGGGMNVSPESLAGMEKTIGLTPLKQEAGLCAFENIIKSGWSQLAVAQGDQPKLREWLMTPIGSAVRHDGQESITGRGLDEVSLNKTIAYIKEIVSNTTKVPAARIRDNDTFDKYGVDSVMLIEMGRVLEQQIGPGVQSAFVEYPTVRDLSKYLLTYYSQQMAGVLGVTPQNIYQEITAIANEKREAPQRLDDQEMIIKIAPEATRRAVKEVAVIGINGRYPSARDLNEFWQNLVAGRNCITEIPSDRWDYSLFYDPDKKTDAKICSKWGGFIAEVDQFDPLFFNISPREAVYMDPQERLMLETVWHALEDAGYSRASLIDYTKDNRQVGVFMGSMYQQYPWVTKNVELGAVLSGNSYWSIANRISYFLGINGPSISVDTACSSSLSALHLAMESIQKGECAMAIVGGVNLSLHPYKYLGLTQANLLGSKDRSMSLGDGDGYVPGEGVGVIILKGLETAEIDDDRIYCVIKASVMNHSGKSSAFKAPSGQAQKDLVIQAFKESGVHPETVGYYETASNGSTLGDAVEIEALKEAYQYFDVKENVCAIGSVKSNIGHLEAASGMSQLAKVILQFQNKTLVPSINSEPQNSKIDLLGSPFFIQKETREWQRIVSKSASIEEELPLRAAINSIGAGGTNVTLILEEYLGQTETSQNWPAATGPVLLPLSARTVERLEVVVKNLKEFIENSADFSLGDLSYSLYRREPMEERLAIIAENKAELISLLNEYLSGNQVAGGLYRGSSDNESALDQLGGSNGREDDPAKLDIADAAERWVKGSDSLLKAYFNDKRFSRLQLPFYPFDRERYWLDEPMEYEVRKPIVSGMEETLLTDLKEVLAGLLQLPADKIKEERTFDKYGMDSLTASRMINILKDRYGKRISLPTFFNNFSLSKLSKVISEASAPTREEMDFTSERQKVENDDRDFLKGFVYYLDNLILSCLEEGKINTDEAIALRERILFLIEKSDGSGSVRNLS